MVVAEPEQPVSSSLFQLKHKGLVAIYTMSIFAMSKVARENIEIKNKRHFLIILDKMFLAQLRVLNKEVFFFFDCCTLINYVIKINLFKNFSLHTHAINY